MSQQNITEELHLVLGCFGRREGEFVFCPSVSNRILKIDENLEHYDEMMDYFESLRLFDKPMFDNNAIKHMVYNMQDRFDQAVKRLWTEREFDACEKFIVGHRKCGLFSRLVLSYGEEDPHMERPDVNNVIIRAS